MIPENGSSPRGRGTPGHRPKIIGDFRFIPARAGNASDLPEAKEESSVHPRAGGERTRVPARPSISTGSSPRGRGTRSRGRRRAGRLRFIPARAGNAGLTMSNSIFKTVHPRAGGERGACLLGLLKAIGSSPRGRGTLTESQKKCQFLRFIPARAGNARGEPTAASARPVHPRAGGERLLHDLWDWGIDGSSPRGRGTLLGLFRR